ncbi:MAG: urease accessory protein UreF [Cytophagaceae bacterium SCN 52-12]|nr:MAG: urease accessory protein UreF [Cytophagaceae bacterium SCN 52-12]
MPGENERSFFLGSLLHLSDPTLPIGGYTHSNGLETYVQERVVKDPSTVAAFARHMLAYNLKYNDGIFMRLAYEAASAGDPERLTLLDQECSALKCAREIREASQKLGVRLHKIFCRRNASGLIDSFAAGIGNEVEGYYCIVFGAYAQHLGIPLRDALFAFYYNASVGMVTNGVKLVPLGQLDGQDIMFDLQPLLRQLTEETMTLDPALRGICNVAFDIRCMQHERLYSRLYMS